MDYAQTVDFLMQHLPMFSRSGNSAFKPGLDNIAALCNAIGNPQNKFPSVHIAGTNGKGSVSHLLAAAFQQNGYKTGLYTSPHLTDYRERFRINGQLIEKQKVVDFVEQHLDLIEQIQPSYFELSVALAFHVFAEEKVDIAIIEVGLGGRLDSTNIITPELSVITQIGFDHTDILGNTLAQIAGEKAGIIKEKIPVVIGETHPETEPVFVKTALLHQSPVVFADQLWEMIPAGNESGFQSFKAVRNAPPEIFQLKTDLLGSYQESNLKTAIVATQVLNAQGWKLPLEQVLESFSRVKERTGLQGRWEIIHRQPKVILEVAHNVGGIAFLAENISREKISPQGELRILIGFVKDKDINGLLQLLPKDATYYFTQAHIPRALDAVKLSEMALDAGLKGTAFPEMESAVAKALQETNPEDLLLVTGSFFIVGEASLLLKGSVMLSLK